MWTEDYSRESNLNKNNVFKLSYSDALKIEKLKMTKDKPNISSNMILSHEFRNFFDFSNEIHDFKSKFDALIQEYKIRDLLNLES